MDGIKNLVKDRKVLWAARLVTGFALYLFLRGVRILSEHERFVLPFFNGEFNPYLGQSTVWNNL